MLLMGQDEQTYHYWCCLCDHFFSPVSKKEKLSPLEQRIVHNKTSKHTRKSYEKPKIEWAKRLQKCWKVPSFDELLTTVTPIIARNSYSQSASIQYAKLLTNGFDDMELPLWTYVLLGRRKVNICKLSNISKDYLIFARFQVKVESLIDTMYCETLQYWK